MATLTVRNLPDDLVDRLKEAAARHGRSREQEVRLLLQTRYAARADLLESIRRQWNDDDAPTPDEVREWRDTGRS
jgi:plasmid stability protein